MGLAEEGLTSGLRRETNRYKDEGVLHADFSTSLHKTTVGREMGGDTSGRGGCIMGLLIIYRRWSILWCLKRNEGQGKASDPAGEGEVKTNPRKKVVEKWEGN